MFICALSGTQAPDDVPVDTLDDGVELPRGWTVLTFRRSTTSPEYVEIKEAMNAAIAGATTQLMDQLSGLPDGQEKDATIEQAKKVGEHTVRALWHTYVEDHPEFEMTEATLYLDTTQQIVVDWLKTNLGTNL